MNIPYHGHSIYELIIITFYCWKFGGIERNAKANLAELEFQLQFYICALVAEFHIRPKSI